MQVARVDSVNERARRTDGLRMKFEMQVILREEGKGDNEAERKSWSR